MRSKVEQRIGQRQFPHGRSHGEIRTLPRRFVGRLVETGRLLLHFLQPRHLRLHVDAEGLQGRGQLPAPGQGHADNLRPVQSLAASVRSYV